MSASNDKLRAFKFGRNWKKYVMNAVNEKVLMNAKCSLLRYLPAGEYINRIFVDVGCGSGIFSLSAILLGARKVISFDSDKESLEAVKILRNKFSYMINKEAQWDIFVGDILDENLVKKLENAGDIVYSWGVLHHTGSMWRAIENASRIVKRGGYFIIAIYNRAISSHAWWKIKKFYVEHPALQPILGMLYGCFVCFGYILKNKTFNLYRERGMHVFYDAIDWIGGYPYEFASFDEVKENVEKLGFRLLKSPRKLSSAKFGTPTVFQILRAANTGCNEFVFIKS